jgi:hypothetical protein
MSGPVYILNNRIYKSINGFYKALRADCYAESCNQVGINRQIKCKVGAAVVAVYQVDAPEIGKPMRVTNIGRWDPPHPDARVRQALGQQTGRDDEPS